MSACPACQGLPTVRPCTGFCVNIMKGCLAHHYQIDEHWAKFIGNYHTNSGLGKPTLGRGGTRELTLVCLADSLTSLSERLVGPFNVEMTVEPISIKISDAIMNFQESGFQVMKKSNEPIMNVYSACQRCNFFKLGYFGRRAEL
jgi:hypothetical protein